MKVTEKKLKHARRHHRLNTPVLRNGLLATFVALGQGLQAAGRALDQLDLLGEVGTGQRCDNRLHALCVQQDGLATPATARRRRDQMRRDVSRRADVARGAPGGSFWAPPGIQGDQQKTVFAFKVARARRFFPRLFPSVFSAAFSCLI